MTKMTIWHFMFSSKHSKSVMFSVLSRFSKSEILTLEMSMKGLFLGISLLRIFLISGSSPMPMQSLNHFRNWASSSMNWKRYVLLKLAYNFQRIMNVYQIRSNSRPNSRLIGSGKEHLNQEIRGLIIKLKRWRMKIIRGMITKSFSRMRKFVN